MVFERFGADQKKQEKHWQPRHDVTTLQRLVNRGKSTSDTTLQLYRDFCLSIIKSNGDLISRENENVWTGVRKTKQQRLGSSEKTLSFCISSFPINYE